MALPEHILDHQARALAQLVSQYRGKTERRTNLLGRSQEFDKPYWGKNTGVTVVPNADFAPDGTSTADHLVYDGTGNAGEWRIWRSIDIPPAGTIRTASISIRSTTPLALDLYIFGGSGIFEHLHCEVTTTWKRFEVPATSDGSGYSAFSIYSPYSDNSAFTVSLWGAQMEAGAVATDYIPSLGDGPTTEPGPVIERLISVATAEHQTLEDQLWAMLSETIDSAEGVQLDVYGKIVGQPREGRSDAIYRLWIKVRVLINRSDGTGPDIIGIFHALVAGTASIVLEEVFPAGLILHVGSTSNLDPVQAGAILQKVKAGGVQAIFEGATSEDTTSFACDPNGAGFGHGGATSTMSAPSGTSQAYIDVVDASAFTLGDTVTIDTAGQQETAVIQTKTATRLTFTANLTKTHASGVTATVANAASLGGTLATAF